MLLVSGERFRMLCLALGVDVPISWASCHQEGRDCHENKNIQTRGQL